MEWNEIDSEEVGFLFVLRFKDGNVRRDWGSLYRGGVMGGYNESVTKHDCKTYQCLSQSSSVYNCQCIFILCGITLFMRLWVCMYYVICVSGL